jgi:uroporphyrinogen III methyltransferase/synthase
MGEAIGKVYLVGAGPGDPGLITLRGVQCLARADVVLYDYLVNPRILRHAPRGAERDCLGRHGHGRILPQDEINERMIALAKSGKTVVRLKGGDPAIFARGVEECEALVQAGIPFEIVPGITAALAAGSCAGIPVTHRELASAVALVTGQECRDKERAALDQKSLAEFPGTLVYYMGVTTVAEWTSELIAAGKPADTPAAVIRRCSLPDQLTIRCTLGEVAETIDRKRLRPPVIIIVGEVAALSPALSWFEHRPLFGVRVMIARPADQVEGLAAPLEELGAEVIIQPAIEIAPPDDWSPVDDALARLGEFDWLVFTSRNGVRFFLERLLDSGRDLRALGHLRLAAIGPGTAQALSEFQLAADVVPDEFRAESLAASLAAHARGKRFLYAQASRGRDVLIRELAAAGGEVERIVAYRNSDVEHPDADIAARLASGEIDWIAVTSSAIARSLVRLFGADLNRARLVSISLVTSETLRSLGLEPAAEARDYTMPGIVEALLRAERAR